MATAVSAAEMAMENKNILPVPPGIESSWNTAKLMSVAFRIQLDADKYRQRVAAGKEPIDACEKHDSRNYQIIFHVYHNSYLYVLLIILRYANNKMLTASKGSR